MHEMLMGRRKSGARNLLSSMTNERLRKLPARKFRSRMLRKLQSALHN
jgi:hypothetical protein